MQGAEAHASGHGSHSDTIIPMDALGEPYQRLAQHTRVGRAVKAAANFLDSTASTAAYVLRQYPLGRLAAFGYLLLIHMWVIGGWGGTGGGMEAHSHVGDRGLGRDGGRLWGAEGEGGPGRGPVGKECQGAGPGGVLGKGGQGGEREEKKGKLLIHIHTCAYRGWGGGAQASRVLSWT